MKNVRFVFYLCISKNGEELSFYRYSIRDALAEKRKSMTCSCETQVKTKEWQETFDVDSNSLSFFRKNPFLSFVHSVSKSAFLMTNFSLFRDRKRSSEKKECAEGKQSLSFRNHLFSINIFLGLVVCARLILLFFWHVEMNNLKFVCKQ